MPYVTRVQIDRAKEMDLLTYLQTFEPNEVVRFSGNVYTTRTHDSLKISNGKWCWWSHDIGGRSALDYLIKVRGMELPEAVLHILDQSPVPILSAQVQTKSDQPQRLLLPEPNRDNERVISYLLGRGIHRVVIDLCIQSERLYESKEYHNAVFVGFDKQGVPRYGAIRGTNTSRYMGDVAESDKRFSFSIPAGNGSERLHLFESAIDLMSYCTLEYMAGYDLCRQHSLSLAGIYKPRKNVEESTPPAALTQYLQDYPQINEVALHLDNDAPGRAATRAIQMLLGQPYCVSDEPPKRGKDMNDYLRTLSGQLHLRNAERV